MTDTPSDASPIIRRALFALGLACLLPLANAAYPDRPIKLIVGFPAGQATDVIARMFGRKLQDTLGQPVVVENKPGATGTIGADAVAKATPDGYTLFVGSSGTVAVSPNLYARLPYHPTRDFQPISLLAVVPLFLAVNPQVPAQNAAELVRLAKAEPGKLNYSSAGNGATTHITMELFKHAQGVSLSHVPYKGSPAAITDLISGHVQAAIETGPALLPHMRSGKLRILAVASKNRNAAAPDVPTMAEAGLVPFEAPAWVGVSAPKGTPKEVMDALQKALANWKDAADVREQLNVLGAEPSVMSSDEYEKYIQVEIDKWGLAVKLSGAKLD